MKQRILHITILVALLIIPGCLGGGAGNGDPGGLGGPGLAPIVNAGGGTFADNDGDGGNDYNICPQDDPIKLDMVLNEVRNSNHIEGDETQAEGLTIYMGNNHYAPGVLPDPSEPYVEIALDIFEIDSNTGLSQTGNIEIHVVFFEDWEAGLSPLPKITTIDVNDGIVAATGGDPLGLVAKFEDDGDPLGIPGIFDQDHPLQSLNWLSTPNEDKRIIVQICQTDVEINGQHQVVRSNGIILDLRRGNSPNETNDPPNTIIQPL